jgi:hypothetical protein
MASRHLSNSHFMANADLEHPHALLVHHIRVRLHLPAGHHLTQPEGSLDDEALPATVGRGHGEQHSRSRRVHHLLHYHCEGGLLGEALALGVGQHTLAASSPATWVKVSCRPATELAAVSSDVADERTATARFFPSWRWAVRSAARTAAGISSDRIWGQWA